MGFIDDGTVHRDWRELADLNNAVVCKGASLDFQVVFYFNFYSSRVRYFHISIKDLGKCINQSLFSPSPHPRYGLNSKEDSLSLVGKQSS